MTALKSYTDIEQSRKLAEFLPLESADMMYHSVETEYGSGAFVATSKVITNGLKNDDFYVDDIPCWSLTALLGVLPFVDFTTPQLIGTPKTLYRCMYNDDLKSHAYDNPIDAVYELVLKLHELKILYG